MKVLFAVCGYENSIMLLIKRNLAAKLCENLTKEQLLKACFI